MQSAYISGLRGCVQYILGRYKLLTFSSPSPNSCSSHNMFPHFSSRWTMCLFALYWLYWYWSWPGLCVCVWEGVVLFSTSYSVDSLRLLGGSRGYLLLSSMSSLLPNSQINSPSSCFSLEVPGGNWKASYLSCLKLGVMWLLCGLGQNPLPVPCREVCCWSASQALGSWAPIDMKWVGVCNHGDIFKWDGGHSSAYWVAVLWICLACSVGE